MTVRTEHGGRQVFDNLTLWEITIFKDNNQNANFRALAYKVRFQCYAVVTRKGHHLLLIPES